MVSEILSGQNQPTNQLVEIKGAYIKPYNVLLVREIYYVKYLAQIVNGIEFPIFLFVHKL